MIQTLDFGLGRTEEHVLDWPCLHNERVYTLLSYTYAHHSLSVGF